MAVLTEGEKLLVVINTLTIASSILFRCNLQSLFETLDIRNLITAHETTFAQKATMVVDAVLTECFAQHVLRVTLVSVDSVVECVVEKVDFAHFG
jgi:hypothetical protein